MQFPEEPLDLPVAEGGGFYPARIGQKIDRGKLEIIRKLGHGPRSSTWLVWDAAEHWYLAVKIYTVAGSAHAQSVELPILQKVFMRLVYDAHTHLPILHRKFWEESAHGSHICFAMNALSRTVLDLQASSPANRLPVHAVQKVVHEVAAQLRALHAIGVMHGAVDADNVFFWRPTAEKYLTPEQKEEPAPQEYEIGEYVTYESQPLRHQWLWNDDRTRVAKWPIYLASLVNAQQSNWVPEWGTTYSWAPETLGTPAKCSLKTDIWMLGCLTMSLLTGTRAEPWHLRCPFENGLKKVLSEDDAKAAGAFIEACLQQDPEQRPTAKEIVKHEWLTGGVGCSCGFC